MNDVIKLSDKDAIKKYLTDRLQKIELGKRRGLTVVFDITNRCNLRCVGCGVNAKNIYTNKLNYDEITVQDAVVIFQTINEYISNHIAPIYLYIGGGEPFLHNDLKTILAKAAGLLGSQNIAIDTNGTRVTVKEISDIENYVDRIGISIDGLEKYHNWWRNPTNEDEKFDSLIKLIQDISSSNKDLLGKIEISTVVTKKNIDEIPEFIPFMVSLGIKKIFFHRAIPVGRLLSKYHLLPDAKDYFSLLEYIAKITPKYNDVEIHLHNSLESIYINLFLGKSTYNGNKIGEPNTNSCIGIDSKGNVYFDPWHMTKPFSLLSGGNLLKNNMSLENSFEEMGRFYTNLFSKENRCLGCTKECSGGSRVAAAVSYFIKSNMKISKVELSDLQIALRQIDPACIVPFVEQKV